ncbi:AIPR family protein [Planomicrobium okeanokoites]|uniref:AIPR family protein n=1 Tax=Planomicrobium okeanokoites TaxID=244 RepID=UPI0015C4DDEF|nr:AIPR family protein [Planomicrobium okeanokoites]
MTNYSHFEAFDNRTDLKKYGDNAHLLYALDMYEKVDDIHSVAANSLTDGNDDKKCDLVYIDEEKGTAILAQGYFSKSKSGSAPANKASDLNTAVAWLLNGNLEKIGNLKLKPKAKELREAIINGSIEHIELWYVHNCQESVNVLNEIEQAEKTAHSILNSVFKDSNVSSVKAFEVGNKTLEQWYIDSQTVISVTEEFNLKLIGGYEMISEKWKAYVTTVSAEWIYDLYEKYGENKKLFSANVRDYLGHRNSDKNINNTIKTTASNQPNNFWVYNNGITALVNNFQVDKTSNSLTIKGISIVNGAQTTGSIGSLKSSPNADTLVPIRFVKCDDTEIVQSIINYNNSQNKIEAADFRSKDSVQKRLRDEFSKIKEVYYDGGRRSEENNAIKGAYGINYLPAYTIAQTLMAFQEKPIIAANKKSEIWINNDLYSKIFNDSTNAENIIFVYSLFRSLENYKLNLDTKESLTETEEKLLEFLRIKKSYYIIISAISYSLEDIMAQPLTNKERVSFGLITPEKAIELWNIILQAMLKLSVTNLIKNYEDNLIGNEEKVQESIKEFRSMLSSFREFARDSFDEFSKKIIIK